MHAKALEALSFFEEYRAQSSESEEDLDSLERTRLVVYEIPSGKKPKVHELYTHTENSIEYTYSYTEETDDRSTKSS
jgi:hypothetical protein